MSTTTLPKSEAAAQAIIDRRNIRHFKPDALSPQVRQSLLELTLAAPSSWNLQDWKVVLIQSEGQKQALSQAAWGQQQIVQAPITFVFVADPQRCVEP